jgi:MoxR-like ATPase
MKLRIGYPDRDNEMAMLESAVGTSLDHGEPPARVLTPGQLRALQEQVIRVGVNEAVRDYLVRLAHASRGHRQVTLGLSPRGLLIWQRLAQARAFLDARDFVTPDDIQDVAYPVLEVHLGVEPEAAPRVLDEILTAVPVPVDRRGRSSLNERRRDEHPPLPEDARHAH